MTIKYRKLTADKNTLNFEHCEERQMKFIKNKIKL